MAHIALKESRGGMPERLVVGATGVLELVVPAAITFVAGGLYQLWLVSVNSQGSSAPGPKQNWTAG